MKTLIIHDLEGCIISTRQGQPAPREPIGVPFLWVEIPEGKRIKTTDGIGVDVTKTPHEVILEDIPATENDILKTEITELKQTIDIMLGGETVE